MLISYKALIPAGYFLFDNQKYFILSWLKLYT